MEDLVIAQCSTLQQMELWQAVHTNTDCIQMLSYFFILTK